MSHNDIMDNHVFKKNKIKKNRRRKERNITFFVPLTVHHRR